MKQVELRQVAKGQIVEFVSMVLDETCWERKPAVVHAKVVKQKKAVTEVIDLRDGFVMLCDPDELVTVIL